jgi:hypothetical protein
VFISNPEPVHRQVLTGQEQFQTSSEACWKAIPNQFGNSPEPVQKQSEICLKRIETGSTASAPVLCRNTNGEVLKNLDEKKTRSKISNQWNFRTMY